MQRQESAKPRLNELLNILSVPRLNGSFALINTRKKLGEWLDNHAIPNQLHQYRLFPYFMEIGGVWLIVSQLLLTSAVWFRWGWAALPISIISLSIMILETKGIHILSRLMATKGENIVIEFMPSEDVEQEIILSAHFDSKTELFDDNWRNFFMDKLPVAMVISLLVGLLGTVNVFVSRDTLLFSIIHYAGIALTVPQLGLLLPVGINFIFGRFAPPSQGAVDNGAACAISLGVAEQIVTKAVVLKRTKVTIVIFSGEEVVVQGSRAYVKDREFPYPTTALNLELMGQDGNYFIWEKIGDPFSAYPTTSELNLALEEIIVENTQTKLLKAIGPAGTDSLPFLIAGIPATSLASVSEELGLDGLHTPKDCLERISVSKIHEGIQLLLELLRRHDS